MTLLRRTGIKRSTKPMKRSRLRPFSKKTIDSRPERQAVVAAIIARDKVCQFWPRLSEYLGVSIADLKQYSAFPACRGPLTAHEPGHRRNVGHLNVAECIALCAGHNTAIESFTGLMRENVIGAGLLRRANGDPIRKTLAIVGESPYDQATREKEEEPNGR